MMSAVAELLNTPNALVPQSEMAVAVAPSWTQGFVNLERTQKMRLGFGFVLVVAIAIAALVFGRSADYRVLYANLSDKDGGAILAQLSQMNIPYKHAEGGSAILVPSDRVNDLRMRLASQGLPKGTVGGFEMMEANRFGMTQFQERLTFQRGLEGELTRSIQALSSVQSARVHLALPNQNGFFREQQKASASVLLSLHPGRILDRTQIAGIIHLVASSVPEMSPSAVSVLDDSGKLLSQSPDSAANGGNGGQIDVQQLQYVQQLEQGYAKRIMEILEPVVGRQNVRAQVSAEVDFSQTESTSESHKPNQGAEPAAVRSLQVLEAGVTPNNNLPGVPGAVSNQPPATPTASINGATPTLTAGAANGSAAGTPGGKKEMITNYEVDKTVRVVRGATAVIKRVNAAVVLNNTMVEEKGKSVSKPLSPQQLEQLTALVRESIGFSKERGDSVNVVNAAFAVEKNEILDVPLWKQPDVLDAARSYAWPITALLFAFLVMQTMVKPALKAVNAKPILTAEEAAKAAAIAAGGPGGVGSQLNAIEGDNPQRPDMLALTDADKAPEMTPEQLRLEDARALTRSNPLAVANIVKGWVNGEPA